MKKIFLLIVAGIAGIASLSAQTSNRSLTLSYGYLENTWPINNAAMLRGSAAGTPSEGQIVLDAGLWSLGDKVTFGLYAGAGRSSYVNPGNELVMSSVAVRYGLNAKLHLLSLMGSGSEKWDVAFAGMLGSMYGHGSTLRTEYGAGLSVSFFPMKHFGITGEYLWGGFSFVDYETVRLFDSHQMLKLGLTYRF